MANVGSQVRAVYDFSGEPGSAELSIAVGEVLTVTRQDVGEGWWEGTNEHGQTGLFPEAYVEEMGSRQPLSVTPPPLPDGFTDWDATDQLSQARVQRSFNRDDLRLHLVPNREGSDDYLYDRNQTSYQAQTSNQALSRKSSSEISTRMSSEIRSLDSSSHRSYESSSHRNQESGSQSSHVDISHIQAGSSNAHNITNYEAGPSHERSGLEAGDYWQLEDWDEDVEGNANSGSAATPSAALSPYSRPVAAASTGSADDDSSGMLTDTPGWYLLRRSIGFSAFGRSAIESFITICQRIKVPDDEGKMIVKPVGAGRSVQWDPITEPYSCIVTSPKKESKLKGLKSFIVYQLTPSFNHIQVSRRYKHFDWLHERLTEKFCLIPIPPLPDKQISGRYEEQFIEHRRVQLQAFVDYMCRHPVLSKCSVWHHFITCTDEKRWKSGKRREERERLLGAHYLYALEAPNFAIEDLDDVDKTVEEFASLLHSMDGAIKNLLAIAVDLTKKHQGPYKREYQKIGQAFMALGLALEGNEPSNPPTKLSAAVKHTGDAYSYIGDLVEDQPNLDWEPFADMLHIYKGIIAAYSEVLNLYRCAVQRRRSFELQYPECRPNPNRLASMKRRTNLIILAVLAEITHFHALKAEDFTDAMKEYIMEQINFYDLINNKLRDALVMYERQ